MMDRKITSHPTYGVLSFSRRSSMETSLFGSSIQHNQTICLELKHAEMCRSLNYDHYFGKKKIVEVEMSQAQFAELITSMNIGDGIPVTIRYTEKDGYLPECPFVDKRQQFEQEFDEHLTEIRSFVDSAINEMRTILEKKSIGKGDRESILGILKSVKQQLGTNTDFIYSQFNEQMDKTMSEAKSEIEAFYQNKLNSIAQSALANSAGSVTAIENPTVINQE